MINQVQHLLLVGVRGHDYHIKILVHHVSSSLSRQGFLLILVDQTLVLIKVSKFFELEDVLRIEDHLVIIPVAILLIVVRLEGLWGERNWQLTEAHTESLSVLHCNNHPFSNGFTDIALCEAHHTSLDMFFVQLKKGTLILPIRFAMRLLEVKHQSVLSSIPADLGEVLYQVQIDDDGPYLVGEALHVWVDISLFLEQILERSIFWL